VCESAWAAHVRCPRHLLPGGRAADPAAVAAGSSERLATTEPAVSFRWVAGRECRSDGFELEVERVGPASLEVGGGEGV
jgi:hypothetical protein